MLVLGRLERMLLTMLRPDKRARSGGKLPFYLKERHANQFADLLLVLIVAAS